MAGKGQDRATLARIGAKTRFSKGGANTKKAASKSVAVRRAQAALRSSDAILEADKNGTLANIWEKMVDAVNSLFAEGKYDTALKHSEAMLEMVNGRQLNIKADADVRRNVIINFRRATPEDAK